jgi:hypothetical protein
MSDIFSEVVKKPSGMIVPRIVADLTPAQLADICNGCGPESMKVKLIPDSILGVNFRPACDAHDACYHFGQDEWDKRIADRLFLGNLLVAIDAHCAANGILDKVQRVACRSAAFDYYKAVADWGDAAFWAHKGGAA